MKRFNFILVAAIFCLILSSNAFSYTLLEVRSDEQNAVIENNLLNGLESDNLGLRISSAYFLGEYKMVNAVMPLIKMLHTEKEESARIQAALSLIKIGESKGVFMVKQAAKFDESKRVRNFCSKFYNAFLKMNDK